MSLSLLRAGACPPDISKDDLWKYLIDLVWDLHDSKVESLWKRLQELGSAYTSVGTFPFYCENIRLRSMILHGKAREVFHETATTLDNKKAGERINLRLNLALHLNEDISGLDLWSFFGGSLDTFSKKHLPRFADILNTRCTNNSNSSERLIDRLRSAVGTKNRTRDGQVYIGIRKPNTKGISTVTIDDGYASARLIPGFFELEHQLPITLLDFNDINEEFAAWFASMLRESANTLRDERGVPRIGEGWVSETALFASVRESFPDLKVVQHGRPKWLGRQHFDIWIPEAQLAIEYHGAQHFRPVAFFGGEASFKATQERDNKKLALAKRHGVLVLVVTEDMSGLEISDLVQSSIRRRLRN